MRSGTNKQPDPLSQATDVTPNEAARAKATLGGAVMTTTASLFRRSPRIVAGYIPQTHIKPLNAPLAKMLKQQKPFASLRLLRASAEAAIRQFAGLSTRADRNSLRSAAEDLWGRSPPILVERSGTGWHLNHSDGRMRRLHTLPTKLALQQRGQVREDVVRGRWGDEQRLTMLPLPMPIRLCSFGRLGIVNTVLDVRKRVLQGRGASHVRVPAPGAKNWRGVHE